MHELAVHQVELELQNEELRRSQAALARSELHYQQLFDRAPLPFILVAETGAIVAFNEAAAAWFAGAQLRNVPVTTLFRVDDTDEYERQRIAMERTGEARRFRVRQRPGEGEGRWLQAHIQPIEHEGSERGYLLALADVTAEQTLRVRLAQADRMTSMGQLAASVAHEVNNPLTFLLGEVGFLDEALADRSEATLAEARTRLGHLRDGLGRIRRIARSLTSFSRFATDDPDESVDLAEAARHALVMTRNELRFRCRIIEDLRPVPPVQASEAAFAQVFLNLLLNALHALPESDPDQNRVTIRTWTEGARACGEVADTGRGIPRGEQQQVWQPFFTTRGPEEGTGLGLAIVRQTIEDLGGTIELESEVGEGTRVRFSLPGASVRHEPEVAPVPELPDQRRRVLVVDDEPMILITLQRFLSDHFDVVTAEDGLAAQRILEGDSAFDAVLCDVTMPGKSGIDVHEWLVAQRSPLAERTLFMTGGVFRPAYQRYLEESGAPILSKPFDIPTILTRINEYVEAKASS